jgi:CRP-like cAMP-binding protein
MDDDFDFTKAPNTGGGEFSAPAAALPTKSRMYNAAVARKLFELGGTAVTLAAGETFFIENDKVVKSGLFGKATPNRMFFLSSGEVTLTAGGRTLATLRSGEIFGEMAVISSAARTATATAASDCAGYALDAAQFQSAIQRLPEFALMLMSMMFERQRLLAARLAQQAAPTLQAGREAAVFDAAMLAQLEARLEPNAVLRFAPRRLIMREGEAGAYMYVLLAGCVSISIRGKAMERLRAGSAFGEMALVDPSPRTASAEAVEDCTVLAINRAALLSLVRAQPAFAIALLKAVADRLRQMNGQLV